MKLNLYLIEDDKVKSAMLPWFSEALSNHFPHLEIRTRNQTEAFRDSGNILFIEQAIFDRDGLLVLDLFLPGDDRENVADCLIRKHLSADGNWKEIWTEFGGPRVSGTKLASVIAYLASRQGCRTIWNSTQNEIPDFHGIIPNIAGRWPLIPMPPRLGDDQAEALNYWQKRFVEHRNALETMLETFRQSYVDAERAWTAARAALKAGQFSDNDGLLYTDLFSLSHTVSRVEGAMHNAGNHKHEALSANRDAMRTIADSVLQNVADDHLVWFLKGIDRGNQIYLPALQSLLEPLTQQICSSSQVVDCGASAGLVLKAIQTLKAHGWQCERIETTGGHVIIHFLGVRDTTNDEATRAVATLQLTPRERMIGDSSRDDPGPCVLALDYLKPVSITADGNKVRITLTKKLQPIT